jgi:hypothetical protein
MPTSPAPLLLLLHDSPLRTVSEAEALATLNSHELAQPRRIERIDTRHLADDINGGYWRSSHSYLRETASRVRAIADEHGAAEVRYFSVAEVPHVIALGAYLGDERLTQPHDFDRDRNQWDWSTTDRTLELEVQGAPHEAVNLPGPAVVRVEVSYPIQDSHVIEAIGQDRLAEIRIVPKGRTPAPGVVRSFADVQAVRAAVREALGTLATLRPNLDVIHLFVAAPVSVCAAIGQELRLRNGKDVQTYRFRPGTGAPALTPAILLTNGEVSEAAAPLSEAARQLAQRLRPIWSIALDELREHARVLKVEARTPNWYANLQPTALMSALMPFPGLKPIWELVGPEDRISPTSAAEFAFLKEHREWRLSDELVLGFFEAAGRDENRTRDFARLFLWHEYIHHWQVLTSYTARDIGQLANCLERADYIADAYALFHQVDFLGRHTPEGAKDTKQLHKLLIDQTGVALRSFWVFEPAAPFDEIQERRLRRYLNWYWRRAQFLESPDLAPALQLLARQPCIEISGLRRKSGGANRSNVVIHDPRGLNRLQIGIMLEDGRLERRGSTADARIEELIRAFAYHDRDAIERFFNAMVDHLKHGGGVFVREETSAHRG